MKIQRRAPTLLLYSTFALTLFGVACLIVATVYNYGPLYTVGGIFIGFAMGFNLSRQAMVAALEQLHRGGHR